MWDLIVVGSGPAGSAAALAALQARPGARVLLLDKAAHPRDKSCGDGIAPHALDELARLGVADVLGDRFPVRRLRLVSPGGRVAARQMARPTYVVPRTVLDARLAAAAERAGAVRRRQVVRSVTRRADAVQVDDERTRAVVGADGAHGIVRRQLGLPRQPAHRTAIAIRGYAAATAGEVPEQLVVMDDRRWPAYAWSFDAGDGTRNVGYGLLVADLPSYGRAFLADRLHALLPDAVPERLATHHLPLSTHRPTVGPGPIVLAGDALSLINPLTGEGIYYALLSGRLAGAAAVGADDPGRTYALALRAELGQHLRHTALLDRVARRGRGLNAGVAAAGASAQAFDALVEVGLGRGLITAGLLRAMAGQAVAGVSEAGRG